MFLADAYMLDRQETRAVKIALVGRIQEETAATFDLIDDGLVQFFGDGGAAFAAAEKAPLADMFFADIISRMHDDRALVYMVVPARLDPVQVQGIAMLSHKGIPRDIKAEAGHQAVIPIGKTGGHKRPGIAAMRHPGVEEQTAILHVDDKQAFLGAGERKIHDRQHIGIVDGAGGLKGQKTRNGIVEGFAT